MAQLYLLNLQLNICIDNDSSEGSSNSSTYSILSFRRVLIWVGIVTSKAFSLTEMIWFLFNSSWIIVDVTVPNLKGSNDNRCIRLIVFFLDNRYK